MNKSAQSLTEFQYVLPALLSWFRFEKADFLIIGGIAVSLLSKPRMTKDIDSLIFIPFEKIGALIKSGEKYGFYPRIQHVANFAKKNRVILLVHKESEINTDISLAGLPFEFEMLKRSSKKRFGNLTIPLPTVEDLIIMKSVANRAQDWVDIHSLLEITTGIKKRHILKTVKEFATVLEMPELNDKIKECLA